MSSVCHRWRANGKAGMRGKACCAITEKMNISVAISSGVSYAAGSYFVGVLPG
jgi:hypothetical protein